MPTGYTAAVQDGKATFGQFVWSCARNFGALITMRDAPMDAPIPEFEPSAYERDCIAQNEAEIAKLEGMTPAELELLVGEERRKATETNERYRRKHTETRERYLAMLSEVQKWDPPSADHAGLKKFIACLSG